jgi:hypothetical protein
MQRIPIGIGFAGLLTLSLCTHAQESTVIVDQTQVASYWIRNGKVIVPHYPRSAALHRVETCLAVGFAIEATGKTDHIAVLKTQTNAASDNDDLKEIKAASTDAIAHWTYLPAPANASKAPVYTYTTLSMALSGPELSANHAKSRAQGLQHDCDIPDFAAAVTRGDFKAPITP